MSNIVWTPERGWHDGPEVVVTLNNGKLETQERELIVAWRFFREHAGYSTPPGRVVCAWELAIAEAEGRRRGWYVAWENDECNCEDFDVDCPCKASRREAEHNGRYGWNTYCEQATLMCYAENPWDTDVWVGESLGGICSADNDYRRVVAAELMAQALAPELAVAAQWTAYLSRLGIPTS